MYVCKLYTYGTVRRVKRSGQGNETVMINYFSKMIWIAGQEAYTFQAWDFDSVKDIRYLIQND